MFANSVHGYYKPNTKINMVIMQLIFTGLECFENTLRRVCMFSLTFHIKG